MGVVSGFSAYWKTYEPDSYICIVKNLDVSVTNAQLDELFSRHGKVKVVVIKKTNAEIGYVGMSNLEEAEDAKNELNGYALNGHILEVHLRKLPGLKDLKPTTDLRAKLSIGNRYKRGRTIPGISIRNKSTRGGTIPGVSIRKKYKRGRTIPGVSAIRRSLKMFKNR